MNDNESEPFKKEVRIMLSRNEFVQQSLNLHLFFIRIMKEHSFFLEVGFTPRDTSFTERADAFRRQFDGLLEEAISLANGVVSSGVLESGEVVTPFTLEAERATIFFTSIQIPTQLTQAEERLTGDETGRINPMLEQRVSALNQRAINATTALIQFKKDILRDVLNCEMFTFNYPLLIRHIIREAELYLSTLKRLQDRQMMDMGKMESEIRELEFFWNRQMAEHAKFIRGLLDPTENDLINQANMFGREFDQLTEAARRAMDATVPSDRITEESLRATEDLRNFKRAGTQGILACRIRSIIIPLLADHVLREANHYLRLLRMFARV
jgi:hypothetical protein